MAATRTDSAAPLTMTTPLCPFLELPTELRLMVYELIPIETKSHDFDFEYYPGETCKYSIITASMSAGILAASRQIQAEATDIIVKKLSKIRSLPARMQTDLALLSTLQVPGGPLGHIENYLAMLNSAQEQGKHDDVSQQAWNSHDADAGLAGVATPHTDLEKLMRKMFLPFQKQRVKIGNRATTPTFEIGIRPQPAVHWSHFSNYYSLRDFGEHIRRQGDHKYAIQYVLRVVEHSAPADDDMDSFCLNMRNTFDFNGPNRSPTAPCLGTNIGLEEFRREWSAGERY